MNLGELPIEALEERVGCAAALLAARPGVHRIWLFGRAGRSNARLDWRSDLDFAVEGLPAAQHGGTWAELDAALDVAVDLVRWEEASPLLRAEIEQGRLLYEN